jgi:hypothetical protein
MLFRLRFCIRRPLEITATVLSLLTFSCLASAQSPARPSSESQSGQEPGNLRNMQAEIEELKRHLVQMNVEMAHSRDETRQLREELDALRRQVSPSGQLQEQPQQAGAGQPRQEVPQAETNSSNDQTSLSRLEEQVGLQQAALNEQNQTKVESASQFRMRISGAVIFNTINNIGSVNNLDFPGLATPSSTYGSSGSFGMSLRQSSIGLEVFGPSIDGVRVSGNVQFDFAGGFQETANGAVLGLPRLRTGVITIGGPNTELVAGQDAPFFSPLSPSSIASIAIPALSYSGNLWTWTPQIRIEHRVHLSENSKLILQTGVLDPLAGEAPTNQGVRTPGPGESSRIPAVASRVAWDYAVFGHDLTLGAGGYYSRQDWGQARNIDAWAGTADWLFPVTNRWEFSGEFYRGRGLGGLGGALGRSIVAAGPVDNPDSQILGLDTEGGWAQLKFRQTDKLEWNVAFGQDNPFTYELRKFPFLPDGYPYSFAARNRSAFVNFIYRPRSDLIFSLEYRHLQTFMIQGPTQNADQINLGMGILF